MPTTKLQQEGLYEKDSTIHVELTDLSPQIPNCTKTHIHRVAISWPNTRFVQFVLPYRFAIVVSCADVAHRDETLASLADMSLQLSEGSSRRCHARFAKDVPCAERGRWYIPFDRTKKTRKQTTRKLRRALQMFFELSGDVPRDGTNKIACSVLYQQDYHWLLLKMFPEHNIDKSKRVKTFKESSCRLCNAVSLQNEGNSNSRIESEDEIKKESEDPRSISEPVRRLGLQIAIRNNAKNTEINSEVEDESIVRHSAPYRIVPFEEEPRREVTDLGNTDESKAIQATNASLMVPRNTDIQPAIDRGWQTSLLSWKLPPCPWSWMTVSHVTITGFTNGFVRENGEDNLYNAPAAAFVAFFNSFLDLHFRGCQFRDKFEALQRVRIAHGC